jgi:hypothetical protein
MMQREAGPVPITGNGNHPQRRKAQARPLRPGQNLSLRVKRSVNRREDYARFYVLQGKVAKPMEMLCDAVIHDLK